MSRRSIFGIVCYCLFASSASVGWGQDYLDLPDDNVSENGPTLTDRFLSLKDKFRREAKPPAAKSAQRSKPRAPRYRNTSKSSSRAQRSRRDQQSVATVAPPKAISTRVASRPKTSDLLPDSNLFSRGASALPKFTPSKPKQLARAKTAKTLPRAGSTSSRSTGSQETSSRLARRSPTTSRANELDAALADLLKPQAKTANRQPTQKSILSSSRKTSKTSAPIANDLFDLRKALLDDADDAIAADAAEAVETAIEPKAVVAAPAKKQKSVKAAPVLEAKPAKKATPAPVIVATPKAKLTPAVVSTPIVIEPIVDAVVRKDPVRKDPVRKDPVLKETAPKQAITLTEPRATPTFPRASSPSTSQVVSDPFEGAAKQVFSTPQQPSNPMRAFQSVVEQERPTNTIARPERDVLQTSQQPVIVSHVEGPRSILVGREATYQVTLENTSDTSASNLLANINVPEWAELVDAMSTSGVVKRSDQGANAGALEWKLSKLAPHSSQALRLRLIPRSGRPLQLGIRWSQAPVESQTIVEVQEPKLELTISGPKEVRYGKPQRYRLTLSNPGTGLTEQVSLRLTPPGGDPQSATTQKIGDLKPGEVKDIDLELTAREAGELLIQADAYADGGLKVETTKTVLCRKPELKVDWRGPDKKYAGTVAAYYFRVRNPGTAATEPVDMSVKLPVGAEFVSASEGYSINTTTGTVSWRLAAIDVNEEQFMQLRCKIARPGSNDFELIAKTSDGELSDSKDFHTEVVALADLKLEVTDPQGPLPLGETVVYEIRVRNRGTTDAENINIVGLFSEGIDPKTVEGAQFTVRDGRVSFHPIKNLPAGREVLLRIHAKASLVGTHTFRTEVTCPKLDIKLAVEETTRFYEDTHRWEDGQTPYSAERKANINR